MTSNLAAFKIFVVLSTVVLLTTLANAAEVKEVKVFISGGFSAALQELALEFERATGNKVVAVSAPSMGETPEAIPNRLKRGEPADVLIMVGYALDNLIKQGMVPIWRARELPWQFAPARPSPTSVRWTLLSALFWRLNQSRTPTAPAVFICQKSCFRALESPTR